MTGEEPRTEQAVSASDRPDSGAIRLLEPLRPAPEKAPLVVRAERLAAALAPYEASPRLDVRFRLAIGELALTLRGLEGMRANDFAIDVVDHVTNLLTAVLEEAAAAIDQAVRELKIDRPGRRRVGPAGKSQQGRGTTSKRGGGERNGDGSPC